jgi:hypothetical protein
MSLFARFAYRLRQFRLAFFGPWPHVPDEALSPHISPNLITLFRRMTPSEQAHSQAVLGRLLDMGHSDPDLLAAALLHDAGKSLSQLSAWERGLVVLGKHFLPRLARRWGEGDLRGAERPFIVAAQHPAWGADLAANAGATPKTCDLIRRHQDAPTGEDAQLRALQQADDFE